MPILGFHSNWIFQYVFLCIWLLSFYYITFQRFVQVGSTMFSVQFSCSVVSDSLQPHGLQHAGFPCPSPTPRACSNSCPLSWWCHPPISSSVVPFSSCLQSCPSSWSFLMSQFFASGGQSFSFSISPSKEYAGLISFRINWFWSPRDSQESSPTPQFKSINYLAFSFVYSSTLTYIHDY